jgi:excisionase family DNA binding protein
MRFQMTRVPVDIPEALVSALADAIAERVASRLADSLPGSPDRWLTSTEAAEYLGLSVDALHKLTSTRSIPFAQDGPGAKLYFLRAHLDAWRLSKFHDRSDHSQ